MSLKSSLASVLTQFNKQPMTTKVGILLVGGLIFVGPLSFGAVTLSKNRPTPTASPSSSADTEVLGETNEFEENPTPEPSLVSSPKPSVKTTPKPTLKPSTAPTNSPQASSSPQLTASPNPSSTPQANVDIVLTDIVFHQSGQSYEPNTAPPVANPPYSTGYNLLVRPKIKNEGNDTITTFRIYITNNGEHVITEDVTANIQPGNWYPNENYGTLYGVTLKNGDNNIQVRLEITGQSENNTGNNSVSKTVQAS